jgi:hypothetical protein
MLPRLEDTFGELLLAAFGAVAAPVADPTYDAVYDHVFKYAANPSYLPWMTAMRYIPKNNANLQDLVEIVEDSMITTLAFTIPAPGLMMADMAVQGRVPSSAKEPNFGTLNGGYTFVTFEDGDSIPISCVGGVTVDGNPLPSVGATITVMNGLTTPQQEYVIGSYYPDDFIPITRSLQVRLMHKIDDLDLYQKLLINKVGTSAPAVSDDWSPAPFYAPLIIEAKSPVNIGTDTVSPGRNDTPYSIKFTAQKVYWQVRAPVPLTAGQFLVQEYIGTVVEPAAGDYATVTLRNARATQYATP